MSGRMKKTLNEYGAGMRGNIDKHTDFMIAFICVNLGLISILTFNGGL